VKLNLVGVRAAVVFDISALEAHQDRHIAESGRDGDFIFTPVEVSEPERSPEAIAARLAALEAERVRTLRRWSTAVTSCDWERVWVIADKDQIFGDLRLVHRPPIPSSLHRATLMMGIERSHRRQGYGSKLMTQAIEWARLQPSLHWLQLYVFADNLPAQALYKRFGFKENGRVEDMFRVSGVSITDISMELRLR
jgi:RimJ/RimL family protein N-acetyltransferase